MSDRVYFCSIKASTASLQKYRIPPFDNTPYVHGVILDAIVIGRNSEFPGKFSDEDTNVYGNVAWSRQFTSGKCPEISKRGLRARPLSRFSSALGPVIPSSPWRMHDENVHIARRKFPSQERRRRYLRLRRPKKTERKKRRGRGGRRRGHVKESAGVTNMRRAAGIYPSRSLTFLKHVEARKWLRAHYAKALCALFELSRALCFPVTRPGFLHARAASTCPSFLAFSLPASYSASFSFFLSFFFFFLLRPHVAAHLAFVAFRERVKRSFFPLSLFFSFLSFVPTLVEKPVDNAVFLAQPFPDVFTRVLAI
ncbi:PREDICTED: uncharacterized protein LOC106745465 [Dinoponera quadriceps]|uniref:Uncharacterized protein LOC106745465 n=1 Tax=Dinoponera quadriceps TaxID=609295 RepID=A0A6P3XEI3_DINQU|nr:PREDICTED: uncharacterized protein LOC106745465 [Dinoponera quadriceps]